MRQPIPIDRHVIQRVMRGEEPAFREMVDHYHSLLYSFIADLTRNRELAEEITQDIFLQIWMSREVLNHVVNFHSYLFVMAKNHSLNCLRSALRERKRFDKWQQEEVNLAAFNDDTEVIHPKQSLVMQAIEQLPAQQRTAWIMSRRDGKMHTEIAQAMHISKETVKKHIQYANAAIRKHIEQHIGSLLIIIAAAETFSKK
jgi:RNA polymerase sigma-70 factor (family 1)